MGTIVEQQQQPDANQFGIAIVSNYDRHDADIIATWQSQRPEKKLAELTLLECNFLAWARGKREELAQECANGG